MAAFGDSPGSARRAIGAAAVMAAAVGALAAAVIDSDTVSRLDTLAGKDLRLSGVAPPTDWSLAATALGSTHVILALTAVAVVVLATLRHWRAALAVGLSIVTTEAAVMFAKALVSRPRPPASAALEHASGFSFPSGHAAASMALYGMVAVLAARGCRGWVRFAIIATGGFLVLSIGASRVFLAVHYPTDVVAGWLTGALLAAVSWTAVAAACGLRQSHEMAAGGLQQLNAGEPAAGGQFRASRS